MDDQLQQLIDLQKEQNQLLKRYLWRLRFSLLGLLLLTTATAVGLGVLVYQNQNKRNAVKTMPITGTRSSGTSGGTLSFAPRDLDKEIELMLKLEVPKSETEVRQ